MQSHDGTEGRHGGAAQESSLRFAEQQIYSPPASDVNRRPRVHATDVQCLANTSNPLSLHSSGTNLSNIESPSNETNSRGGIRIVLGTCS